MINKDRNIINDEKGGFFVFGPWWFVIIVMIIALLAQLFKNNEKNRNTQQVSDYVPVNDYVPIKTSLKDGKISIICPQCGKNNKNKAKFCNSCGANLANNPDKYCSNCGAINTSNAKFCQECGNAFEKNYTNSL